MMSSLKSLKSLSPLESSPGTLFPDAGPAVVGPTNQFYMANRAPSKEQEPETLESGPKCEENLDKGREPFAEDETGFETGKLPLAEDESFEIGSDDKTGQVTESDKVCEKIEEKMDEFGLKSVQEDQHEKGRRNFLLNSN